MRIDEVPAAVTPKNADHLGGVVAADRLDLVELPEVELALDALGVGVLGGEEAAVADARRSRSTYSTISSTTRR